MNHQWLTLLVHSACHSVTMHDQLYVNSTLLLNSGLSPSNYDVLSFHAKMKLQEINRGDGLMMSV